MFGRRQSKEKKEHSRLIERLDERIVKYVTQRDPETSIESVIGRNGCINTKNGQITIVCDGSEVFRCDINQARCGELLSLEGVAIHATDPSTGKETIIIAYYKYYR
ncbi:MAG TPA: hypothetical protein DEB10_00150 [Ruminococcaceae bacterium]|nr:hypothetical protein [Oscillospiraceae bacterium]